MSIENKEVFSRNLKKYVYRSGKDRKVIAKDLSVPYSTFTDWMNGRKYPRINSIEKISSYFNVSKSELIEDMDSIKKDNDLLSTIIVKLRMNDELLELVDQICSLDRDKIRGLKEMLDTFI